MTDTTPDSVEPLAQLAPPTGTPAVQAERITRSNVFGTVTDSTLNFNQVYYSSTNEVFQSYRLSLVKDKQAVPPGEIESLLALVKKHRLILLEAPEHWGQEYVAEFLAYKLIRPTTELDGGRDDEVDVLVPVGEVNGQTVVDALPLRQKGQDEDKVIKDRVLYIARVTAASYTPGMLNRLSQYASQHNLFIIMTTTQKPEDWRDTWQSADSLVSLSKQSPYSDADLTRWLCNRLNDPNDTDLRQRLIQLDALGPDSDPVAPQTPLSDGDALTVQAFVAEYVRSPYMVRNLGELLREATPGTIGQTIKRAEEQRDRRLQDWFNNLEEEERYMVLAVGLLNNIPEQTFWAIYEKLVQERWRVRDTALRMSDYRVILARLKNYIEPVAGQIRFVDQDNRRKIIYYALQAYRRSLTNALPFIADLITSANSGGAAISSQVGINDDLQALEIWGTDLAPSEESRSRRERLRDSLIASLVEIDRYESITTDHILQAWAERDFAEFSGQPSTEANIRIKQAFSDTLLRMHWRDNPEDDKDYWETRRSLRLLSTWYSTIQREDYQLGGGGVTRRQLAQLLPQIDRNRRRSNLRMTIAFTLCDFCSNMDAADYGSFDDAADLLAGPPAAPMTVTELRSLWHMLMAMTWEDDPTVRLLIAEHSWRLLGSPERFQALLTVLVGDWNEQVRVQVAGLLATLVSLDLSYLQWINYFLISDPASLPDRSVADDHYLADEVKRMGTDDYPSHLWTATLAMVYVGGIRPDLFRIYLHTLLKDTDSDRYLAFTDVFARLVDVLMALTEASKQADFNRAIQQAGVAHFVYRQSAGATLEGVINVIKTVLNDRDEVNRLSEPARTLSDILKTRQVGLRGLLSSNELQDFEQADNPIVLKNTYYN
ncbi:MAG: hypothetical protein ACOCYT_00460 [Chloroflexota bacterium]